MKYYLAKIKSFIFLFIFLLAVFFCITTPFELRNVILAQSWEPRELEIQSSEIITSKSIQNGKTRTNHSIKITAIDLSNNETITINDVKYGDIPFTFSAFGDISGGLERYVEKYPAGAKTVSYKDPNSEKYILEQGNITTPVIILVCSLLWILGNVFIMIFFPKKRKEPKLIKDVGLD